jgi:tRNA pseudouridine38-40 synthase
MRNLRMILSYDGFGYHGWQRQKGQITVQQVLEEAIGRIVGEDIRVIGSGRTDAGVHALKQVAHFKTRSGIGIGNLHRGINSLLPEDVVVRELDQVDTAFHARYDARSKVYCYQIWNGPVRSPLCRRFAWFVRAPLDGGRMGKALNLLKGTHDFSSFCAADHSNRSPVRTIMDGEVVSDPKGMMRVSIEADGFLKHMVRNIVGTLVEVGSGRRAAEDIPELLEAKDRSLAGVTAPPGGLFLKKVKYG